MARPERAGGASLTASGGQVAGRTSQATALVALAPPAPGGSQALPSGAPRASGSTRVLPGARSHAVAGAARAHRRALGATAPAPATAETANGPSGGRSSPGGGSYVVGRPQRLVLCGTPVGLRAGGPFCQSVLTACRSRAL